MSTTRKTITVNDKHDKWIKANTEAIRAVLIEAEQSGEPQFFDAGVFKQEMIAKHGKQDG